MTGKGEPEQGTNCVSQQVSFLFSIVAISYLLREDEFTQRLHKWPPEAGAYSWLRGSGFLERYLRSDLRWKQGMMMMTRIDFLLLSRLCSCSSVSFDNIDVCRSQYHPRHD